MNALLQRLLDAHGGLARWNAHRLLEADMIVGGALWDSNGQADLVRTCHIRADLKAQHVLLTGLSGGALVAEVSSDEVRFRADSGRPHPSVTRPTGTLGPTWDAAEATFFHGYAMWTYVMQPFLWSWPGFEVEEIAPWSENGEEWRRLAIVFPDTIARHSREQVAYVGPDGLLRRFDYAVDLLGGARGAHYPSDYRRSGGILVAHRRRIYPIAPSGHKIEEPVLVSVDLEDVAFAT